MVMSKKQFYHFTEGFSSLYDSGTEEQKMHLQEALGFYIDQYYYHKKNIDNKSVAHSYNKKIDESIEETIIEKISCKKGCFFCCRTNVVVTDDEAALLLAYAKDEGITIDWDLVERQSKHDHKSWKDQPLADQRCPFLSDKGECKVYEFRPSVCRKLFVTTEPKYCDTEKFPGKKVKRLTITDPEIIVSAIWNATECGTMGKMLMSKRELYE